MAEEVGLDMEVSEEYFKSAFTKKFAVGLTSYGIFEENIHLD